MEGRCGAGSGRDDRPPGGEERAAAAAASPSRMVCPAQRSAAAHRPDEGALARLRHAKVASVEHAETDLRRRGWRGEKGQGSGCRSKAAGGAHAAAHCTQQCGKLLVSSCALLPRCAAHLQVQAPSPDRARPRPPRTAGTPTSTRLPCSPHSWQPPQKHSALTRPQQRDMIAHTESSN